MPVGYRRKAAVREVSYVFYIDTRYGRDMHWVYPNLWILLWRLP